MKKILILFFITSLSNNNIISSIEHKNKKIFGLQFHPEVYHSLEGKKILSNFLFKICKIKNKFKLENFLSNKIKNLRLNNTEGNLIIIKGV